MNDYHLYKPIRNKIRTMNHYSLLDQAIIRLHEACHGGMPVIQKGNIPWEILLLVKWVLMEFDPLSKIKPPASEVEMNRLLNKINHLFDGKNGFLQAGGPHGIQKFFRQMSFQQFWLQVPLSGHP